MRVIGLDLSFTCTGIAIIDGDTITGYSKSAGVPKQTFFTRVNALWNYILPLCTPKPDMVVIEGAAYDKVFRVFDLGQLNGAIKYLLALNDLSYIELPPKSARKIVCGDGNLSKLEVASQVELKFGYKNNVLDIIDAFVVAKAYILGYQPQTKKKVVRRKKKIINGEIGEII